MKVLLTTLNSKFIHSNLAIRYLKACTEEIDTNILEFNINQSMDYMLSEIYKGNYNIVGISTYIWNINQVLELSYKLKVVKPNLIIILGGPEVSFNSKELLEQHPCIDFIIRGEGEAAYSELLTKLSNNTDISNVKGITYRSGAKIIDNPERKLIEDLDQVPSPFNDEYDLENKIIYYESSRGCPFNCSFCLSSTIKGLRFFNIDRVKKDIEYLISRGVKQVKFVDRTFNASKSYSREIMEFIMEKDPIDMNFHFEVTAHLLDRETLEFLKSPKKGLFQFEVGIQSTNPKTIEAVGRTTDFTRLSQVVKTIKSYNNIHQHVDLIVGLPYEDYNSFANSFNQVYDLDAEKIQVGFLKLLKGSLLRAQEQTYGIKYYDNAPYEVLETNYLNYEDVVRLKNFEDIIEKYHNEEYFKHSINYIVAKSRRSPFHNFMDLTDFWVKNNYNLGSVSRDKLYRILIEYAKSKEFVDEEEILELIKYDYYLNNNQKFNKVVDHSEDEVLKPILHSLLKEENILMKFLEEYEKIPTKKIINQVKGIVFKFDIIEYINTEFKVKVETERVVLFNYMNKNHTKTFKVKETKNELYRRYEKGIQQSLY